MVSSQVSASWQQMVHIQATVLECLQSVTCVGRNDLPLIPQDMRLGLQSVTCVGRNDMPLIPQDMRPFCGFGHLEAQTLAAFVARVGICGSMKELVVPDRRCSHLKVLKLTDAVLHEQRRQCCQLQKRGLGRREDTIRPKIQSLGPYFRIMGEAPQQQQKLGGEAPQKIFWA